MYLHAEPICYVLWFLSCTVWVILTAALWSSGQSQRKSSLYSQGRCAVFRHLSVCKKDGRRFFEHNWCFNECLGQRLVHPAVCLHGCVQLTESEAGRERELWGFWDFVVQVIDYIFFLYIKRKEKWGMDGFQKLWWWLIISKVIWNHPAMDWNINKNIVCKNSAPGLISVKWLQIHSFSSRSNILNELGYLRFWYILDVIN